MRVLGGDLSLEVSYHAHSDGKFLDYLKDCWLPCLMKMVLSQSTFLSKCKRKLFSWYAYFQTLSKSCRYA